MWHEQQDSETFRKVERGPHWALPKHFVGRGKAIKDVLQPITSGYTTLIARQAILMHETEEKTLLPVYCGKAKKRH